MADRDPLRLIPTPDWDLVQVELRGFIKPAALARYDVAGMLRPGRPVVFNGIAPVWLYGYLATQAASAPWVACGAADLGAVVVRSRTPSRAVGATIPSKEIHRYLNTPPRAPRVVAIVGPPHSGKTVFRSHLDRAIRARLGHRAWSDVFLFSTARDGEGKWSQRVPRELASTLRRKGRFTRSFALQAARKLRALREVKRLVVADLGGKIDDLQTPILEQCTEVLIVSRSSALADEWRAEARRLRLPVIAEVASDLGSASRVVRREPLLCRLGPLERGRGRGPVLPRALLDAVLGDLIPGGSLRV